eukprot:COSAG01_NODE_1561_length_9917_cov_5.742514_2_plen_335_part_00
MEAWLDGISRDVPGLLPPLRSEAHTAAGAAAAATASATSMVTVPAEVIRDDTDAEEREWGCWGGVRLPVVGDHPWLRPHPPASAEGAFRARALALLARAGVSVRAVFGRMYASAPHVGVVGLSQSEAVCLPAAHLPRLLLGGSRRTRTAAAAMPMMREAGVTVSLSVGGRWVEVVGDEVGEMPMSSIVRGVDAVRLTRAESGLLHIHVLDGCAIRHCTSAGVGVGAADAAAASSEYFSGELQPEPEPTAEAVQPPVTPVSVGVSQETTDTGDAPPTGGKETLERVVKHVLGVLARAGLRPSLIYGTLLGKMREGGIMAHDHDCDLLLAATDAPR